LTDVTDATGESTGRVAERPRHADDAGQGAGAGTDVRPTAVPDADERVRLPHEPALDGLRGLAVAAVVIFHFDRIEGGFLGVDLFFVLSGFLITSLLVTEHRGRGTIDLARFWVRRARRLLPALFLVVAGVCVLLLWLTPQAQRAGFRGDGVSTLLYVTNWHAMLDTASYWDMFGQPSPFDHMWSLAIEEQFYLVWPLVALLVLGRRGDPRRLGALALLGAGASFLLLWATWVPGDSNRAYFSTDTRIGPTLLGAVLAVVVAGRPRRPGRPPAALELLGLLALGWMGVCMLAIDGVGPSYYHGGLASFAVATVAVIYLVTGGSPGQPGLLERAIAWRPLALLGTISYGVYLWHWPVIVYLTPERAHIRGLPLDLLRVVVTLAVALASFRFVEQPIRQGALRGRAFGRGFVGAFAVSLVAVLVATAGTTQATFIAAPPTVLGADNDYLHVPASASTGEPKVLLVGDSGPAHLGPELDDVGAEADVSVAWSAQILCSAVYASDLGRKPDGTVVEREPCPVDPKPFWADIVEEYDPDVVVYYLANAGSMDHEQVDGEWVWDCDPAYDRYLEGAIGDLVELFGQGGARVVIATSPYAAFPDVTSGQRVDCRNATYRRVAAAHPGTEVVDLNAFVTHEVDTTDVEMFADPVHLSDEGARRASIWLLDELFPGPEAAATAATTTTTTTTTTPSAGG
jgi:peptidoglycan/LPS O-acetylase OafA/YrhL